MTTRTDWVDVFKTYDRFRDSIPNLDMLIHVSKALSEKPDAADLYPSMSCTALRLSTAEHCAQRFEQPMVYFDLAPNREHIEIHYQSGQGLTESRETFTPPLDESLMHRILSWLNPDA